ncbi:putative aliphatic sulfonates-binding protein [anaerobic digester metagenome]
MERYIIILFATILTVCLVGGTYNYYTVSEETIIVGYLPTNHDSALFVADAKGMFEKEGVNMQLVPFRDGSSLVDALNDGKIDIGYCGVTPVTTAISQKKPIKVVAAVNEEGSGIVVSKNLSVTSVNDFEGKTIAVPKNGSIQDVLLNYLFWKNGLNINEVKIHEMEVPLMPGALKSGEIDVFIAWEPYVSISNLSSTGNVFMYSGDIWKNYPCCVVVASESFINKKPELLRKFLRVHMEATDYVNNHKDETAKIVSKKLGVNLKSEEVAVEHVKFVAIPSDQFETDTLKIIDIQKRIGYIKDNITPNEVFDLQYLPT